MLDTNPLAAYINDFSCQKSHLLLEKSQVHAAVEEEPSDFVDFVVGEAPSAAPSLPA